MKIIKIILAKLVSIEIWIISGCILISIIFPLALLSVVVIGIVFWFIRRFITGSLTERTAIDISILALLLLLPVNLWATALPSKTDPQILRLLSGIIYFYAIVNWARTSRQIRWVVAGAISASVFLALFATISVEWNLEKLPFIPARIYNHFVLLVSDIVHRNVMAGFLVILLPIALAILLFTWRELHGWKRLFLALITAFILGILILTQSRGALLALGFVFLLLVILRWKWGWISIPLSITLIGGIVAYLGVGKSLELLASGVSLEGLDGRLEVWFRAIFMIRDFPFTGVGMGLFGDVADNLYPFFLNAPGSVPHAHNLFLQIAVDLGIPGLIAWLSSLFLVITVSCQLYLSGRKRLDAWTTGLGAGLLCSQTALIVHGFLDAATWGGVRPAPIVWAIWGLTCAAWNYNRKRLSQKRY
jgi:putative inorganic carbon (HCO3(-)) transporter